MFGELMQAFEQADADDEVRAVIVTGAGRAFCAGADLEGGAETFAKLEHAGSRLDPAGQGGRLTLRIFESTKPVIAAINGPAVGIGATMTLPMDVRLAADDARIGFVFARRGIVPEACSSWFLPRVVGISQAMEWVATGRVFGPRRPCEAGSSAVCIRKAELLDAAAALAREIADNTAPVSVALARRMMWTMLAPSIRCSPTGPTRAGCSIAEGRPTRPRGSRRSWRSARRVPGQGQRRAARGVPRVGGARSAETPLPFAPMRVLVLDNYDSFTYNLVQYLGELGAEVEVVRNDHATVDELLVRGYDRVIVSPGPCTPNEAGISLEAVRRFPEAGIPTLGVCLGHQALVQAWGGKVDPATSPCTARRRSIEHDGRTIFRGPAPSRSRSGATTRWSSIRRCRDCLERSAHGGDVVMAVRHRELPAEGVQFHPESVLTEQGRELLRNFLARAAMTGWSRPADAARSTRSPAAAT